jgi:hypothetical protein
MNSKVTNIAGGAVQVSVLTSTLTSVPSSLRPDAPVSVLIVISVPVSVVGTVTVISVPVSVVGTVTVISVPVSVVGSVTVVSVLISVVGAVQVSGTEVIIVHDHLQLVAMALRLICS